MPQPYLVKVIATRRFGDRKPIHGSAVFISPTLLLTCRHVVRGINTSTGIEDSDWCDPIQIAWGPRGDENPTPVRIYRPDKHTDQDLAILEIAGSFRATEIPAWKDPLAARLQIGSVVKSLSYPDKLWEEEDRTLTRIGSRQVQVDGSFTPGSSGGVLEFSEHRHAFCFALIRADQKTIGHAIGYQQIADFLLPFQLTLPAEPPPARSPSFADIEKYKSLLCDVLGKINLGGLLVNASAQKVDIEKLWVPSMTNWREQEADSKRHPEHHHPERMPLVNLVNRNRALAIVGEAGSGKSTFLQRLAFRLCRPDPENDRDVPIDNPGLPLWVPLKDFESYRKDHPGLAAPADPTWIAAYLASQDEARQCGLDAAFFDCQLRDANTRAMLLLDGFDEVSSGARHDIHGLIEMAVTRFHCRIVLTTRPESEHQLPTGESGRIFAGLPQAALAPMSKEAIERFITQWTENIPQAKGDKREQAERLRTAVQRPAIRSMAGNSLMLTAMAVLTSNGQQLPEERSALFEEIVSWLVKSRCREHPERANDLRRHLASLALAMIKQGGANQYQTSFQRAAELIEENFTAAPPKLPVDCALEFLDDAERNTGLLSRRAGKDIVFWHRYLQEFLAAWRLARWRKQREELIPKLLERRECPEVIRLLGGCMAGSSPEELSELLVTLITETLANPSLEQRAYAVGVIGSLLEDLRPTAYPKSADFQRTVEPDWTNLRQSVMCMFEDPAAAAEIPIKTRIAAADALAQAGDPRLQNPNWVRVEGGTFHMGAQKSNPNKPGYDPEAHDDEDRGKKNPVTVPTRWLGKYPVTVLEFARYLEANDLQPDPGLNWDEQMKHPSRPVVFVTYDEAEACCRWLGGRLPTEEEWEFAARGSESRKYPWGDRTPAPEHANFNDLDGAPTPVGLFPAGATTSPDGELEIFDLAGNVREWTSSPYDRNSKVLRGGSFYYYARLLRSAYRDLYDPDERDYVIGFRCLREVFP